MFGRTGLKVTEVMPEGNTFEEAITDVENGARTVEVDTKRYFVVTKGGEFITKFTVPPIEEIK